MASDAVIEDKINKYFLDNYKSLIEPKTEIEFKYRDCLI
jgi:hypothetical protein